MIEKNCLKNGIKVVAKKSDKSFATSVLVMVKTGSRNETPDIHGLTHFLEHMCFKGTKKRPTHLDIMKEIDSMGAKSNAFTAKEFTGYYIQADKRHFENTLEIISDIVYQSKIPQEELAKEKGTIIEEINMYEDTPMALVPDLFEQIIFGNNQMAQNILGEKEVIQSINAETMRKYRDKHYVAGNSLVSVAGNLPEDYLEKIKKYYGNVSEGECKYIGETANKKSGKKVYLKKKDTEQAHIYMGVESYDITNPSKYAQDLLTTILGGNMSSRLFIEIRDKRGLAYYLRAGNEANSDTGLFTVRAGLNIGKVEEAVKVIKEELQKSPKNLTEEELKRAKDFLIGQMALSEEDSINVAEENALEELLGGRALGFSEKVETIEKVTLDEVRKVAAQILDPKKMKLAVIGPYESEGKFVKILES